MNTFGESLRTERIKADLSQADLSNLIGTAQATISHWELGNITPVSENLDKLCELFPALEPIRPECREGAKPAGNPNGNPGPRSEETKRNMAEARKTAAPKIDSQLRLVSNIEEVHVSEERKETVEDLICRLTKERDEARHERDRAKRALEVSERSIRGLESEKNRLATWLQYVADCALVAHRTDNFNGNPTFDGIVSLHELADLYRDEAIDNRGLATEQDRKKSGTAS